MRTRTVRVSGFTVTPTNDSTPRMRRSGMAGNLDLDRLPRADRAGERLRDVGDDPHLGQVGDDVHGVGGLHHLARAHFAVDHRAGDARDDVRGRIDPARLGEPRDRALRHAEHLQAVARGVQVGVGLHRLGLPPLQLRRADHVGVEQLLRAGRGAIGDALLRVAP